MIVLSKISKLEEQATFYAVFSTVVLQTWIHIKVFFFYVDPSGSLETTPWTHGITFLSTGQNGRHYWSRVEKNIKKHAEVKNIHLRKPERMLPIIKNIHLVSPGFICWLLLLLIYIIWSVVSIDSIIVQYLYKSIIPVYCLQNLSKGQDNVSLTSKMWISNFLQQIIHLYRWL